MIARRDTTVPAAAFAGALTITALLAFADLLAGDELITAALVLGPVLASLACTLRQTLVVSAVAMAGATLSTVSASAEIDAAAQGVRLAVVFGGSALAVFSTRERINARTRRDRLELLAELSDPAAADGGVAEVADRLASLIVGRTADACIIDTTTDGRPRRLAARSALPGGADGKPGQPEDDLRRAGAVSVLSEPIRVDGQVLGTLSVGLGPRAPRRDATDRPFLQAIAGRVALTLANAGLSAELLTAERRLQGALDELPAAVLILRAGEGIVYANHAAAVSFGLPDPAAVVASRPEHMAELWQTRHEDGRPLMAADSPSQQILSGANLHPAPMVICGVHRDTGEERWFSVHAVAMLDEDGELEMAVSVTEDVTAIKRGELVERVLARVGTELHHPAARGPMLRRIAEVLVDGLADRCAIRVDDPDGAGRGHADGLGDIIVAADRDADRVTDPIAHAAEQERIAALASTERRDALQAPIRPSDGPPMGELTLLRTDSGRTFSDADADLVGELGRRIGLTLQTLRLHEERSRIAATLQDGLLPPRLPTVAGFELADLYAPAGDATWVGGDFYDVFATPAGWMVLVGDVTGHGAAAAALTAKARHTLRTACVVTGDPAGALGLLNAELCDDPSAMCTACVVLLPDEPDGQVHIACAGHPRPILVREGGTEEVGAWGTILGAFGDSRYTTRAVPFTPGDLLVLYTDGVIDARGEHGRFGEARLHAALTPSIGARDAIGRITAGLADFAVGPQADDTAAIAIRRTAGAPDMPYGDLGGTDPEIAAVRALYAAFERRDAAGMLRHVTDDVELHLPVIAQYSGRLAPYRGAAGVRAYLADVEQVWDELTFSADDLRAAAGAVVVFGRVEGRRGTEALRRALMWTWKLHEGQIASGRVHDLGELVD